MGYGKSNGSVNNEKLHFPEGKTHWPVMPQMVNAGICRVKKFIFFVICSLFGEIKGSSNNQSIAGGKWNGF